MLAKIVVQCANPQFAKRIYIRASGLPRAGARLPPGFRRSWLQAPGYRVGIRYNKVLTIPFTGLQPRGAAGGGLMVPCVGRGPALYGAEGVESAALGHSLELAGFFANGEIGPVGGRTFVHTFSTSVGLLRRRAAAS